MIASLTLLLVALPGALAPPVVATAEPEPAGSVPRAIGSAQDDEGRRPRPSCPAGLELLVERPYAASRGLEPGDRVEVSGEVDAPGCPATIAGVFEPRADPAALTPERPRVVLHLPHLAALAGRNAEVDRFSLRLRPGATGRGATGALAGELERLLPGARVLRTEEVARRGSTTFEVVRRFHRAIGTITMVAGGAFLACIMILKVQERRTPVAALRLVGVSRRTLIGWVVAEAVLVSLLGGLLGLGLGWAASAIVNGYYQAAYETALVFSRVTPRIALESIALALVLGVVAGVAGALRLFASDPLTEVGR